MKAEVVNSSIWASRPFNMQWVHMEDYTLQEQYSLVRNARVIAGIHGAGLAWLAFTHPSQTVAVLEIQGKLWKRRPTTFEGLSRDSGVPYMRLDQEDGPSCVGVFFMWSGCLIGNASEIADAIATVLKPPLK
jgi:hypothetical protein